MLFVREVVVAIGYKESFIYAVLSRFRKERECRKLFSRLACIISSVATICAAHDVHRCSALLRLHLASTSQETLRRAGEDPENFVVQSGPQIDDSNTSTMTRSVALAEYDHDPSQEDHSSQKPFREYVISGEAGVSVTRKRFGSDQHKWSSAREWSRHYLLVVPKRVLTDLFLPVGYETSNYQGIDPTVVTYF